jgi:hypothetical protein
MKALFLLPIFLVVFPFINTKPSKKTTYYYCCSKSGFPLPDKGKVFIVYTAVKEIDNNEAVIKKRTNAWGDFINLRCQNKRGCSSDLNLASSVEDGQRQIRDFLSRYTDTAKYVITKVDF